MQVVAVIVGDVNIVIVVPVIPPVFGPRINQTHPVTVVLEAGISAYNQERQAVDAEPVVRPKISTVALVRNAVAAIAATLLPVAMVAVPMLRAMPVPCAPLNALLLLSALRLIVSAPLLRVLLLISL